MSLASRREEVKLRLGKTNLWGKFGRTPVLQLNSFHLGMVLSPTYPLCKLSPQGRASRTGLQVLNKCLRRRRQARQPDVGTGGQQDTRGRRRLSCTNRSPQRKESLYLPHHKKNQLGREPEPH